MFPVRSLALLLLSLLCSLMPARATATPRVLVTISPLHALTAAVMQGAGTPELLLPGAASPHDFALKPSDVRRIANADLIVRVGESLERQLDRVLASEHAEQRVLDMDRLPGLLTLKLRSSHLPAPGKAAESAIDPHLWLDIGNAGRMAEAIAERLCALDTAHSALYRSNATTLKQQLQKLDSEVAARLKTAPQRSYAAFHDGYQYFEHRYGLRLAAAVAFDPSVPLSLKRMSELRAQLMRSDASCLLVEPQHPARLADTVAGDRGLRRVVLDPLGASIPPGPAAYPRLMQEVAAAFTQCLGGK